MSRPAFIVEAVSARLRQLQADAANRVRVLSQACNREFANQVISATIWSRTWPKMNWNLGLDSAGSVVADVDALESLRRLARGRTVGIYGRKLPLDFDLTAFKKQTVPQRFQQLTTAEFPWSLTLAPQEWLREELLRQLMVADRSKLDVGRIDHLDHDFTLLKLNFIAVCAGLTGDLRYLDTINYWYERIPRTWKPVGKHEWLLASLLGIYAQVLRATAAGWQRCA